MAGVAREQARKDLPLSTYTELYWKIDLHNLLHYLSLRVDHHAQYEIRQYAEAIANIVRMWVPNVWAAFLEYRTNAITLHATELRIIRMLAEGELHAAMDTAYAAGWLKKRSRERKEFEEKLSELGLTPPWQEANLE
jgi:thymidylate synthase (FAD)